MRTKKRNAPAGAATPARARNEDFAVNHSGFNSNTDGRKTPQIFALLHTGAENGTTLRELVAATGLNEARGAAQNPAGTQRWETDSVQ